PAVFADGGHTGELVAQAHRALGLVAMLAARTRRAIAIDLALRDQRVVTREQVVDARHRRTLVRFAGRYRRRSGLARRLAGLEVDIDARALPCPAVLDAGDRAAEGTDELRQLLVDADLRVLAHPDDRVDGERGCERADADDLAGADPDREAELRERDRAEAIDDRRRERRAREVDEGLRQRLDLRVDGDTRNRELELRVRRVADRLREPLDALELVHLDELLQLELGLVRAEHRLDRGPRRR